MWTNEVLAYFAGILDGEGHISVELQRADGKKRNKDYYSLRLVIANTNREVIDWLVEHFDGSLQICTKYPGFKQGYKCVLFGEKLHKAIQACYPYLIIKKPIADIAIKFRETVGKTGHDVSKETLAYRKQLYLDAKRINKPGDHN